MGTAASSKIDDLLRATRLEVAPATYVIVGLSHRDWNNLLQNPELSPNTDAIFMIFRDDREVTMVLDDADWQRIRHAVRDAKVERDFRLITLDVELPWDTIGYFARVAELLAQAEISIGALSAFSRDHLLIKQRDLPKALRVLGQYLAEPC